MEINLDNASNDGITVSTVELKTSVPNKTITAEIQTGYDNVSDYSQYLLSKYTYMNTGIISIENVPTSVNVSSEFLKKCMNDPESAAFLEENLNAIPNCINSLVNYTKGMAGNPEVTYAAFFIDDDGNITMMSGCRNVSDDESESFLDKLKEMWNKYSERQEEYKKLLHNTQKQSEDDISFDIKGSDIDKISQKISEIMQSQTMYSGSICVSGYDIQI